MQNQTSEKLVHAYQEMVARVKHAIDQATHGGIGNIRQHIDHAIDKAVELEELSREEAERVGDYLHRDLNDAAEYLVDSRSELGEWMRFDLSLIEDRFLDMFSLMVDHTREELDRLALQARAMSEWHTGEVTGPGTLGCAACGKQMHYHKPGRIPPCPACHHTVFKRVKTSAAATANPADAAADASSNAE